jgi:outer membrane protein
MRKPRSSLIVVAVLAPVLGLGLGVMSAQSVHAQTGPTAKPPTTGASGGAMGAAVGSAGATTTPTGATVDPKAAGVGAESFGAGISDEDMKQVVAVPGGLTADTAATRAVATSKAVKVDEAKIAAAQAAVDTAWDAYFPRLSFTARYTRLSKIDIPNLTGGSSIVVAPGVAPGSVVPPGTTLIGAGFSFPVFLNQYVLQASVAVPLSDYVFRIHQQHESALKNTEATKWNAKVTQLQVAVQARTAYYQWVHARGAVVVGKAAVAQSEAHLKDLKTQLLLKAATTADVYRAEAQLASAQLVVIQAENLVMVTESNLRTLMHASDEEALPLGEDLLAELPSNSLDVKTLKAAAMSKRPELKAVDAQLESAEESKSVVVAGMFPRLDALGNLYYSRPNQRYVPAVDEFRTTWDISIQLTWSPNDYLVASDQKKQVEGNLAQLKATREQIVDALNLEVIEAFSKVREQEASVVATNAGLRAAEESYRVRVEQFHNGATTSALVIDTEAELTRARLAALDARVNLRIARSNLKKAIGE